MRVEAHPEHHGRRHRPGDAVQVIRLLVRLAVPPLDRVREPKDHEEDRDIRQLGKRVYRPDRANETIC